ncbi:MAG: M3 family oligoendopeptidase [Chloroflexia bacterium]|nr:M3 family oligoendopeptidase [Chloroflexia bacterium]
MTTSNLPASPETFSDATWDDIAPYYESLAERPLSNDNVEPWLQEWSTLDELVFEAASMSGVAYTTNTADSDAEAAYLRFTSDISPRVKEQQVKLSKRLIELGYSRDDLDTMLRRFQNQIDLYRDANLPLQSEIAKLNARYQKITGGMTVDWDGDEKTLPQLQPFLLDNDRDVRERAFRLGAQPYIDARDELATLFDAQYAVRAKIAANAGFDNYRDYIFHEKNRFDYTPEDCESFHNAVEQTVVPAVERIHERRRQQMGLEELRPWDTDVDPEGRPALKPFTDVAEFVERAVGIFGKVDPTLGGYFDQMAEKRLLDLESRKGKAPGGYCTSFPHRGLPFIFMNSVGVGGDVRTLLHEAGHAFHVFEAHEQPLMWQRHPGSEMAEVASMSMELLTAPYLAREDGGYYSSADASRARIEHLEGILEILPHIASVDAFQHWIYTSEEGDDASARDAAWLKIRSRFEPGIDWSGLDAERVARWYRQLHIFLYPFYYIEYGIAQLGALQVWRNSLNDPVQATADYRQALALGATKSLPDLFDTAGAKLVFDAETMGELVTLVEEQIAELEAST